MNNDNKHHNSYANKSVNNHKTGAQYFHYTPGQNQDYSGYTNEDQKVWQLLFDRQLMTVQTYADPLFLQGLSLLDKVLNGRNIPEFKALSNLLKQHSGWEVVVVPGLIPVDEFFMLLSQKKFCASTWLRPLKELDYLEEPDMFHDIFGHVPMITYKPYADFMQNVGLLGVKHKGNTKIIEKLSRIYWFTMEFGVTKNKSYGAGLLSSFGEIKQVDEWLHDSSKQGINILPFCYNDALNQPYRTDTMQELYFAIDAVEKLCQISIDELEQKIL